MFRRLAPLAHFLLLALACFGVSLTARAQRIDVQIDEYAQPFVGAGSSIPLYLFNHFTLPQAGQEEALDLIVRDLNLAYLQDYPEFRPSDPANADYFGRRVEYFQAAKAIDSTVQLSMTFSIFPDDLRNDTLIGNRTERRLDYLRPGIYDEVAGWYFEVLDYYRRNGLDIDVVNAVNEPDFITQRYGFGTDSRRGTAEIFAQAIGRLKEMIDDPAINVNGVVQPLIMGPSTIAPSGAVGFINYYKANFPQAWDNIDIVAYHQYTNGVNSSVRSVPTVAEGKPVYQSEMHTNRGDNLDALTNLSVNHRGVLSLAQLFCTAVNGGTNAWFYFLNVFPTDDSNPGLLQIQNGFTRPRPFKHYYAFKQLTSAQPAGARVVERRLASLRLNDAIVSTFRDEGSDTVYVHAANYRSVTRTVDMAFEEDGGSRRVPVMALETRVTDETRNDESTGWVQSDSMSTTLRVELPPYSLSTFAVALSGTVSTRDVGSASDQSWSAYFDGADIHVRTADASDLGRVSVFNAAGQQQLSLKPAAGYARLPTSALAPGVYFVNRSSARGTSTKRVYVARH